VGSVLNKTSFSDVESDEFGNALTPHSQVHHAKKVKDRQGMQVHNNRLVSFLLVIAYVTLVDCYLYRFIPAFLSHSRKIPGY
jgi:hypothetical protein